MLNKTILIGRLTKEPDVRNTTNGTTVASFTLAVDRTFKDKDGQRGADFINIIAWRKTAELCAQYLSKGSQTAICGRLQSRSYTTKDGSKRYVTEVVADEVVFLSPSKQTSQAPQAPEGFAPIDEDLPF